MGSRRRLNVEDLNNRYNNTCSVAKSRSILSVGLSMFKLFKNTSGERNFLFHVQTFNILTLCSEDHIVEPASLKFLVGHGFDFNKHYSSGLPYFRGNDKVIKAFFVEGGLKTIFIRFLKESV